MLKYFKGTREQVFPWEGLAFEQKYEKIMYSPVNPSFTI